MPHDISRGFAFYGYIPTGSDELHLGIVLNEKDGFVKYCYCTSQNRYKYITKNRDFVSFPKEQMASFFKDEKETYIYISESHIFEIPTATMLTKLKNSEYDAKGKINETLYQTIIRKISTSKNLPERFRKELLEFIGQGISSVDKTVRYDQTEIHVQRQKKT